MMINWRYSIVAICLKGGRWIIFWELIAAVLTIPMWLMCFCEIETWGRGIERIVMAGIGAGIYPDSDTAFQTLRQIDTVKPDEDAAPYSTAYAMWVERLKR